MRSRDEPTVVGTVSWTIHRRTGLRGFLARAIEIVAALIALRSQGGWTLSPVNARVPTDPTIEMKLDSPLVRGKASFMPRYVDDNGTFMAVYADRATVAVPRRFETVDVVVPLSAFAPFHARCLSGGRFPKAATAEWELVLGSDDTGERVTVTAPWLTLAWLGHLGGWPEPTNS
ncbi:hypothetical protein ACOCJ7_00980 [Knoellia sp. CPCC 206453]